MNRNFDPERDDPLLDRVLDDEIWQRVCATQKTNAIGAFRARQRQRRLMRRSGAVAIMAVGMAIAGAVLWHGRRQAPLPPQIASQELTPPVTPAAPQYLTDQELLALFPRGSCFLAEVDGKKQLVFFDPKDESTYLSKSPPATE